jgi:hypothetical protein
VKDLLERILGQLPGYLPDLASLVTRPKTAILRWVGEAAGDLTRPLTFVGVSVAIGFLLQLPQLGKEDTFTTLVASMAVFKVLALVMCAAVIQLVFRVAGGHASFSATFSAYLYIVSALYIAGVILRSPDSELCAPTTPRSPLRNVSIRTTSLRTRTGGEHFPLPRPGSRSPTAS